ncbi:MAG TPA: hypothetical protein VFS92_09840 [Planctomycetota bacterium]|nr:hypothetical protein [Planctomycetota bacterium]
MIAPEKVSLSDFVSRRLHPTKVVLAYIRHEMSVHSGPNGVTIDKAELGSVLATVELFIEDYEKLVNRDPRPAQAAPISVERAAYVPDARG